MLGFLKLLFVEHNTSLVEVHLHDFFDSIIGFAISCVLSDCHIFCYYPINGCLKGDRGTESKYIALSVAVLESFLLVWVFRRLRRKTFRLVRALQINEESIPLRWTMKMILSGDFGFNQI